MEDLWLVPSKPLFQACDLQHACDFSEPLSLSTFANQYLKAKYSKTLYKYLSTIFGAMMVVFQRNREVGEGSSDILKKE